MNYHLHYYRQLFCDYDADVPIWRLVLIISHYVYDYHTFQSLQIREGFKKSKWKFKMAFAMKGGGVSSGQGPRLTLKKVTSISKWVGEPD